MHKPNQKFISFSSVKAIYLQRKGAKSQYMIFTKITSAFDILVLFIGFWFIGEKL